MRCWFLFLVFYCDFCAPLLCDALQLKVAPLIGGPAWLPLHVKVVVENDHTWDFVPLNATSPSTLKSLVTLHSVPGEIRYYRQKKKASDDAIISPTIRRAQEFVNAYTDRDLNLIRNNCWTFALMLYWHLLRSDGEDNFDMQ